LHPDTIGKLVYEDEEFKTIDWALNKYDKFKSDEVTAPDLLQELSLVTMAFMVFLVLMICLCIAVRLSSRARNLWQKLKVMIFFNAIIRAITIVYIKFGISFGSQIKEALRYGFEEAKPNKILGLSLFCILFGYPILSLATIIKYKDRLDEPAVSQRVDNFY
jgi:uncharacterized protein YqhQ